MKNKKILDSLEGYRSLNREEDNLETNRLVEIHSHNSFIYGSTPYNTFLSLFNHLKIKPKRFIVVGCSIGWVNFYFNDLNPNIETIGLDIHHPRIDFGNKLIKKHNLKNISLVKESFEDFKFEDGDIIWESNLCFEIPFNIECNQRINNKLSNFAVISYRSIREVFKEPIFSIKKIGLPVSWMDQQNFYVYEKAK
tara:strand:- start:2484 stop:3068 length:585 start_codon:yes stop_codon:yes gene_type:complete